MSTGPGGRPLLSRNLAFAVIALLVALAAGVAGWAITRRDDHGTEILLPSTVAAPTSTADSSAGETTAAAVTTRAVDLATRPVLRLLTHVPAATLATVGVGAGHPLIRVREKAAIAKVAGKPVVLYIGAEFCPYCAAERWALVNALSRFGTVSGLGLALSSPDDVYPSTSTMTFRRVGYASPYISFQAVETEDVSHQPLQVPTVRQTRLWDIFTTAPHGPPNAPRRAIPMTYVAGRYFTVGSQFSTSVIAGLSHLQIARQLANPRSAVSQNVIGAANRLTASICAVTGNRPASACTATIAKIPPGM